MTSTASLIYAEHMGEDFDTSCFGLKPVHVRSVAGLIFICLAAEAPADIDEMDRVMTPYLAPHDLRNMQNGGLRRPHRKAATGSSRWRTTANAITAPANHPELTIPLFAYGFGFAPGQMDETELAQAARYDNWSSNPHARWESCGIPSAEIDHLDDLVTGFRTQRLPIDQSGESQTLDTRVASKQAARRA